ncbi:hypothetical protein M413DRAFT_447262 [Hebeloma cylindrosporum]|uniref:BRCT domain-containing protein n=1 Tax=Hebeloma cylindrosporum TaxID=76867 RepID=A0A0C3C4Y6_HEBCY|nr:hypothetical protein M413DRAFT_447262 [Hebeloma cylindrosporum h7]
MERYFPVVAKKPSTAGQRAKQEPSSHGLPGINLTKSTLSSSSITNGLLTTLSDPHNPITHSNIAERSDYIVPFATGHQVSDGPRKQGSIMATRRSKLRDQQRESVASGAGILRNTRIYINGYLESTTDIEKKRIIVEAGGEIVLSPSRCTHIVTSRGLAGSKTQKILTKKSKVYVVKPEWVLDSVAIGKRRSEQTYAIVKHSNTLPNVLGS